MTTKFITLNVWDTEPTRIKINQGEINSRFLKVQLIDKNQPLNLKGKTVFFYAKKPDGNLIFNTCEIIDEKDGTINLALTSQMSIVAGTMKDCEFHVIDSEFSKLKIKGLILEIERCTDFDAAIESTSEFSVLDKSLKDAKDIINAYSEENIIEKITSMDGEESGIDADLLDGKHGSDYVTLEQFGSAVPQTRLINSKDLSSDIELNCDDIGAASEDHKHDADDITSGTLPIENGGTGASTAEQALENLGAVPQERTINSKPLSSNIELNYTDVGAVPQTRTINSKPLSSNIELNCDDIKAAEENHVHDFSELINTPTTLSGYGITDSLLSSEHTHEFNSIEDKPTTLAGYGITDAATSAQGDKADSAVQEVTIYGSTINKNGNNTVDITLDKIYPVGSIYMSVNSTNPSNYFGGTWVSWGQGRVPVSVKSSDSSFSTVEKTGGEKSHTLSIDEIPSHTHSITKNSVAGAQSLYTPYYQSQSGASFPNPADEIQIGYTGGNSAHNNLQPYITCYMWKRTA